MSCALKRILKFNEAMTTLPIKVFNNKIDITNLCDFSWSHDGVCWTNWTTYQNYITITDKLDTDFYLRILLRSGLSEIVLNNCVTTDYTISIDGSGNFLRNFCNDYNLFQPYNNLDCAIQLQQQLADSICCMFGIPIYYFRAEPQRDTVDYTFKEYVLHNIVAVKQLKLVIKDGAMPSSNPKLTEFDFDWETDWETEISKTQFATAFGDDAYPKYGDFIYIPMMHRMWDVNAAYDEKNEGLMWRSTTWKLQLVKYADSTAYNPSDFDDFIDSLIPQTYENTFGQIEQLEQERLSQANQVSVPMYAPTNLYNIFMEDAIRKQYTKDDITIIDKQYNHRANVLGRNMYRFKNNNGCITYQKGICGDNGTLIFIIETPGSFSDGNLHRDIIQFGNLRVSIKYNNDKFELSCNSRFNAILEAFKSYMCILRWNHNNFTISLEVYNYKHNENTPIYLLKPMDYWFDFENPLYSVTIDYDTELNISCEQPCQIHAYPLQLTNIKYYNIYLDNETVLTESIKYTTNHKNCVINDLARPLHTGFERGYSVK
jgi:hypothetical protein